MAAGTKIEWADASWPIINGCARTSPGCSNCYAERLTSTRLSKTPKYEGLAVFGEHGPRWTRKARLWHPHLSMPLKLKTPQKIFVNDMGDLFWEEVTDEQIDQVFGVMWACLYLGGRGGGYPGHVFQVLTKRAERMHDYMAQDRRAQWAKAAAMLSENGDAVHDQTFYFKGPHPRIWLGVSVENQKYADERIWALLQTPAAVRWVSAEPLLGPVDFNAVDRRVTPLNGTDPAELRGAFARWQEKPMRAKLRNGLDWVVVGGESGPGARSFDLAWARSIIQQCKDAGCAVFFKQAGAAPKSSDHGDYIGRQSFMHVEGLKETLSIRLENKKGSDVTELPEDLRVREFPSVEGR